MKKLIIFALAATMFAACSNQVKVLSDQVPSTKVLINGTLYIIRPDGKIYTAQGAEVR